jgi:hypothetical protein
MPDKWVFNPRTTYRLVWTEVEGARGFGVVAVERRHLDERRREVRSDFYPVTKIALDVDTLPQYPEIEREFGAVRLERRSPRLYVTPTGREIRTLSTKAIRTDSREVPPDVVIPKARISRKFIADHMYMTPQKSTSAPEQSGKTTTNPEGGTSDETSKKEK